MDVVLESAELGHAGVEGILAGVPEGRMAQVVRQGDGLGQVLVEAQLAGYRPANLGHLQRVRQPGAVMVVGLSDEHLRLVHQPPEGGAVDDAVAVALVEGAEGMRRLGLAPAAAVPRVHGVRRQHLVLAVEPVGRLKGRVVRGGHDSLQE
jgi:hypothetical protein